MQPPGADEARALQADTSRLGFSLVYLVHGDAGYAYHDESGHLRGADEDAVAGATEVAKGSTEGEVFIFHQRKSASYAAASLWHHGGADGFLTQYRRGRLLRAETYSRRESGMDFGAETALYRRYAARSTLHFFAYYGHEIPLREGAGYSSSYPDRNFSVVELQRGLHGFAPDSNQAGAIADARVPGAAGKPFSLVVLSTCRGGTPETISALSQDADFVIASPADLHLSYFDTRAFLELSHGESTPRDSLASHGESAPRDGFAPRNDTALYANTNLRALARDITRQSFRRLKENTQTEVTVALYDVEALRPFLAHPRPDPDRNRYLGRAERENCGPDTGVEMLYQPPRFGKDKDRSARSAWECGGS